MAISKIDPAGLDIGQIGGRRNLIINGAMQVAQRGTETTGITGGGSGYYTVDRCEVLALSTTAVCTMSQSSDAPDSFANSLKIEVTTADTSLDANTQLAVQQRLEAQDLQSLAYGTSAAKKITLSFYVKSNKTGTYTIWLWSPDMSKQYSVAYTIDVADTWERKSIVINGETSSSIANDNGEGLRIRWHLALGSTYTTGTLADTAWEGSIEANRGVGQLNLADSTSNYWQITGVQLEVGTVATPFEHRSYGEELALCQRYFYKCSDSGYMPGAGINTNILTAIRMHTPVAMRSSPSISDNSSTWLAQDSDSYTSGSGASFSIDTFSANHLIVRISNLSGLTDNRPGIVSFNAGYSLDAEL